MKSGKIRNLVADLKARAEAQENNIIALRKKGEHADVALAAEVVHQAHITELEYVIDELQQMLLEDEDQD